MILNDKQDGIEHIARILDQTSAWRKRKAAEWPDDQRNGKASELPDQLAIESANLSDEQWAELQPNFGWNSQAWRGGLIQAARMVGFSHRSRGFDSFVRLLVTQLPSSRIAA
jgi:hypothetical protein